MNDVKATNNNPPLLVDAAPLPAERQLTEMQLTNLGSVLNGLEHGASAMHRHVVEATTAVKSGTYAVDASAVSRCIVGESVVSGSGLRAVRKALRGSAEVRS